MKRLFSAPLFYFMTRILLLLKLVVWLILTVKIILMEVTYLDMTILLSEKVLFAFIFKITSKNPLCCNMSTLSLFFAFDDNLYFTMLQSSCFKVNLTIFGGGFNLP